MVDRHMFQHGYCAYFMLGIAERFKGSKCVIWSDTSYELEDDSNNNVLCHAFNLLADNIYLDVAGIYSNTSELEDEFEFNEQYFSYFNDTTKAKELLDTLYAPTTSQELQNGVRNFLNNFIPSFNIALNGEAQRIGIINYGATGTFKCLLLKDNSTLDIPYTIIQESLKNTSINRDFDWTEYSL